MSIKDTQYDICMLLHKPADNDSRVLREAQALKEAGYTVVILSVSPLHTIAQNKQINGIDTIDVPVHISFIDRLMDKLVLKAMTYILALLPPIAFIKWLGLRTSRLWHTHYRKIQDAIKDINARIYHANDYHTLAIPYVALDNPKVIYDVHDLEFDRVRSPVPAIANWLVDKKHDLERSIEKQLVQQCDGIIVVSEGFETFLRSKWHRDDIVVVRNLVDLPDKQPEVIYPASGQRRIVHIGNLNIGRQLDVLVDVLQYLPQDVALILMGKGTQEHNLRAQAEQLGLSNRVHIVPPVSPDRVAATAAQAYVSAVLNPGSSPNRELTYPQKLFESIAAGLPVVAGKTSSVKYLVEKYELGILVDVYDAQSVARGIEQLLIPEQNQKYRKNVETARETLNWQNEKQRLVNLYRDLLDDAT